MKKTHLRAPIILERAAFLGHTVSFLHVEREPPPRGVFQQYGPQRCVPPIFWPKTPFFTRGGISRPLGRSPENALRAFSRGIVIPPEIKAFTPRLPQGPPENFRAKAKGEISQPREKSPPVFYTPQEGPLLMGVRPKKVSPGPI